MLIARTGWLGLSFFLITLLGTNIPVESQSLHKKSAKTPTPPARDWQLLETKNKEWAVINGFRSSNFGMSEKEVIRAIAKDFNISKTKVDRRVLPAENVTALIIHIPKLMRVGGPADIVYLLEHKTNKLKQINIDWGKGVTNDVDGKDILSAANLLRNHFSKKKYKKEGYAVNKKLDETRMLVFRGRDKKGRTIILRLENKKPKKGVDDMETGKNMSLILSYFKRT